jgi:hypothetical protein
MGLSRDIDFIGHNRIPVDQIDPINLPAFTNIILKSRHKDTVWIEETNNRIGEWRGIFRSLYIRWALAINGLHVAAEKYRSNLPIELFYIQSIRVEEGIPKQTRIAEWDLEMAAQAHLKTVPMLNAYGFIDLYGCFEEFIFDLYGIYLKHNPGHLLTGDENRPLKKLYKEYLTNTSKEGEWKEQFSKRLISWQRKRLYDGLEKVFLAYCDMASIQKPKGYVLSNPQTWSETLGGIGLLRHALTHGAKTVSKEIADFGVKAHSNGLRFKENDPLEITLFHLQAVELFAHQLLTALNLSLIELHQKIERAAGV